MDRHLASSRLCVLLHVIPQRPIAGAFWNNQKFDDFPALTGPLC